MRQGGRAVGTAPLMLILENNAQLRHEVLAAPQRAIVLVLGERADRVRAAAGRERRGGRRRRVAERTARPIAVRRRIVAHAPAQRRRANAVRLRGAHVLAERRLDNLRAAVP